MTSAFLTNPYPIAEDDEPDEEVFATSINGVFALCLSTGTVGNCHEVKTAFTPDIERHFGIHNIEEAESDIYEHGVVGASWERHSHAVTATQIYSPGDRETRQLIARKSQYESLLLLHDMMQNFLLGNPLEVKAASVIADWDKMTAKLGVFLESADIYLTDLCNSTEHGKVRMEYTFSFADPREEIVVPINGHFKASSLLAVIPSEDITNLVKFLRERYLIPLQKLSDMVAAIDKNAAQLAYREGEAIRIRGTDQATRPQRGAHLFFIPKFDLIAEHKVAFLLALESLMFLMESSLGKGRVLTSMGSNDSVLLLPTRDMLIANPDNESVRKYLDVLPISFGVKTNLLRHRAEYFAGTGAISILARERRMKCLLKTHTLPMEYMKCQAKVFAEVFHILTGQQSTLSCRDADVLPYPNAETMTESGWRKVLDVMAENIVHLYRQDWKQRLTRWVSKPVARASGLTEASLETEEDIMDVRSAMADLDTRKKFRKKSTAYSVVDTMDKIEILMFNPTTTTHGPPRPSNARRDPAWEKQSPRQLYEECLNQLQLFESFRRRNPVLANMNSQPLTSRLMVHIVKHLYMHAEEHPAILHGERDPMRLVIWHTSPSRCYRDIGRYWLWSNDKFEWGDHGLPVPKAGRRDTASGAIIPLDGMDNNATLEAIGHAAQNVELTPTERRLSVDRLSKYRDDRPRGYDLLGERFHDIWRTFPGNEGVALSHMPASALWAAKSGSQRAKSPVANFWRGGAKSNAAPSMLSVIVSRITLIELCHQKQRSMLSETTAAFKFDIPLFSEYPKFCVGEELFLCDVLDENSGNSGVIKSILPKIPWQEAHTWNSIPWDETGEGDGLDPKATWLRKAMYAGGVGYDLGAVNQILSGNDKDTDPRTVIKPTMVEHQSLAEHNNATPLQAQQAFEEWKVSPNVKNLRKMGGYCVEGVIPHDTLVVFSERLWAYQTKRQNQEDLYAARVAFCAELGIKE